MLPIPPVVETSGVDLPPLLDSLWAVVVFSVNGGTNDCAFMFDVDSRLTLADFKNDQAEKDMTIRFARRSICVTPKLAAIVVLVVVIVVVFGSRAVCSLRVGSQRQKHDFANFSQLKKYVGTSRDT